MSLDLLKFRIFLRPAASRFYPKAVRAFTLAVFIFLIVGGWA
jgi:hypothetical protein